MGFFRKNDLLGISYGYDSSVPIDGRALNKQRGVGYKVGSTHGALKITGDDQNPETLRFFDDQQYHATRLVAFADVYWGPRFDVCQHGQWVEQDHVQLYTPRHPRHRDLWVRTPALLISTDREPEEALDRLFLAAFELIVEEVKRHYNENYLYNIAEAMKRDEHISKRDIHTSSIERLFKKWLSFTTERMDNKGFILHEEEIVRMPEHKRFFERIWNGSFSQQLSRNMARLEWERDLDAKKSPQLVGKAA